MCIRDSHHPPLALVLVVWATPAGCFVLATSIFSKCADWTYYERSNSLLEVISSPPSLSLLSIELEAALQKLSFKSYQGAKFMLTVFRWYILITINSLLSRGFSSWLTRPSYMCSKWIVNWLSCAKGRSHLHAAVSPPPPLPFILVVRVTPAGFFGSPTKTEHCEPFD